MIPESDPCENAIDKPLMYKVGWGRNVDLCLSYSVAEGCRDTTWRYNHFHEDLKNSRSEKILETWLRKYIQINQSKRTIDGWDQNMQHLGKLIHLLVNFENYLLKMNTVECVQ